MNKKVVLIILGVITLGLSVASLVTLLRVQETGASPVIGGSQPVGLYLLTGIFLIAMTVWYLIYRSGNSR